MPHVLLVIAFWIFLATLAAIGIYAALARILEESQSNQLELVQIVLSIMAGFGAVILGVYAYRRQHLQEVASVRDDEAQFLTRYNAATEQLTQPQPSARLAGVYAMARLADDWPAQRQQCVDVLCAYLRIPADKQTGEEEVRSTILQVTIEHLRDVPDDVSWSNLNFNLDGAELTNVDMRGVRFNGKYASFVGAKFKGGTQFDDAQFHCHTTNFGSALFTGWATSFAQSSFTGAKTFFSGAKFHSGSIDFDKATFSSDTTQFIGTDFRSRYTSFQGCIFGGNEVLFQSARFAPIEEESKNDSYVNFGHTTFKASTVTFFAAQFTKKISSFATTTFDGCHASFDNLRLADDLEISYLKHAKLKNGAALQKNGWHHEDSYK